MNWLYAVVQKKPLFLRKFASSKGGRRAKRLPKNPVWSSVNPSLFHSFLSPNTPTRYGTYRLLFMLSSPVNQVVILTTLASLLFDLDETGGMLSKDRNCSSPSNLSWISIRCRTSGSSLTTLKQVTSIQSISQEENPSRQSLLKAIIFKTLTGLSTLS